MTVQPSCSRDSSTVEMTVPWEDHQGQQQWGVELLESGRLCAHVEPQGRAREVTQDPWRSPNTRS